MFNYISFLLKTPCQQMSKCGQNIKIGNMIYEIRGVQIILDSDLAKLFKIETGNLNKSMKRNIERFPKEFCFMLSNDEYSLLLFQIGIAKRKGGRTNLPYAYTEQGVAMISSMLHSEKVVGMSIAIINTFVKMRHFIIQNKDVYLCGASINNIGSKISTIVKLEVNILKETLLETINNIKKISHN